MFDKDSAKVKFPWVAFISQPIRHPTATLIINPIKFQKLYTVWMLEKCWKCESEMKSVSNYHD
ncbi:hypothetical protein [Chamaesiphon sp.]|uniref:hypothetical protein n=1 Tax=Chamaesiphon sp. TaxID=2814140 RepID=UPI003593ADB1